MDAAVGAHGERGADRLLALLNTHGDGDDFGRGAGFEQPYDPCRDGRYSYGRAMSCDELLRKLDREEEERERRLRFGDPDRWGTDPCKDGRYSSGRPMTCAELRERLERRERRRDYGPYYRPYGALDEVEVVSGLT